VLIEISLCAYIHAVEPLLQCQQFYFKLFVMEWLILDTDLIVC